MGLLLHTVTAGKSTDLAFCILTATLTLNAIYLMAVGVGVVVKASQLSTILANSRLMASR